MLFRQCKLRNTLHNGTSVRESMKRADLDVAAKRLKVDVAHSADCRSTTWFESMQHTFAISLFIQLLLDGLKDTRIHPFDLELRFPTQQIVKRRVLRVS